MGSQTFCTALETIYFEENDHGVGDNLCQLFIQKSINIQNIKKNLKHNESRKQMTQLKGKTTYLKEKTKGSQNKK